MKDCSAKEIRFVVHIICVQKDLFGILYEDAACN